MKPIIGGLSLLLLIWTCYAEYIPPGPRYECPKRPDVNKILFPCTCDRGSDVGLYVTCQNAGIAVLSIGLKNIASIKKPIEQLTLKECNIEKIYGPLLHKLQIRVLRIEDTPIKTIDELAFFNVNRTLQDFYLINSKLEEFPKEAFKIMGNLTVLHIDRHNFANLDKDIFADSMAVGKLERLHITNGNISELHVESFQVLRKLKTLDVHGNKLKVLKRNQFKGLRDVEVLDLSYNNITKLEGSHIADLTKLSWCNVSHNELTEITRGMFARNSVLRVLHLNHNKLKRLDTNSFRGMRFLRRLYLSDNEINDVGRGTFASVLRIGTIDLARNKIKKIDFQMFYELRHVELIDVSDNLLTEIQKQSFKDVYLALVNVSHNMISKIEVDAFINCANITVLDLSYNNLTEIPNRAFDLTTYASVFQLSYNQFTILNQIPFHNMTGMQVLNISHNLIHSITKNSFPKLYELHTVDLSYNQLNDIASSVFQPLFSLRLLNLSHNLMEQIKPPTFGTLPTLLELDLSYNLLRDISKGSLAKLASCRRMDVSNNFLEKIFLLPISLGEINLSNNNISEIPANVWPSMNALLKLDLTNNPVGHGLSTESFRGLLTLQTLTLTSVGLENPPWESLSTLSSLQYLKLNKNQLTTLKKGAFGRLPIVFDLDLSDNNISSISEKAFDGLLQLLKLSLRNNSVRHIPNGAFRGLVSLRSLDLSQNQLEKLDNKTHGLLDDCLSLDRVNLSHNRISFINKKTFPSDPYIPYKLKEIDLSYNEIPVITQELLLGTKHLKVLNISNNNVNDIRKKIISNLTSLEVLDLSYNELQDISERDLFRLPPNILGVDLSNNRLSRLPIDYLYAANNLTSLDVRNNTLEYFDTKLVTKMKEKLRVFFGGNPLKCDCFTRPLRHYFDHLPPSFIKTDTTYTDITCAEPLQLKDQPFLEIEDDRLNCIENVAIRAEIDGLTSNEVTIYEKEADIVFREVEFSQRAISLTWYVQTSKDVADFRIIIRNSTNFILFGITLGYDQRTFEITIRDYPKLQQAIDDEMKDIELCILGGKSGLPVFNWYQSQCRDLPHNFKLLDRDLAPKNLFRSYKSPTRSSSTLLRPISALIVICGVILLN